MASRADAGELRTKIQVFAPPEGGARDEDGYPVTAPANVLGEGRSFHCKWVNAYGREVYDAKQAGVEEPATLTLRCTSKITTTSLIYREGDPKPYQVVGVNDVENRHIWLEVRVERKAARA